MERYDQDDQGAVESQAPRFREFLALMLRNKWLILLTALSVMFAVGIYTLQKAPTFEGTAMVLINMKAGQQANPFADMVDMSLSKLANEVSILKTRSLARKVAEQLLANPYLDSSRKHIASIVRRDTDDPSIQRLTSADTIVPRLQRSVSFTPEKESDIIRISATSEDPREAALLVNTYAYSYRDQAMQQSRSQSRSVREFLEGRLAEQRLQLQDAEAAVKVFMESSGMVSLDGESNRVVQELSQLEATRNGLSIEIESLNKKYVSIQSELPQQEASVLNSISQASDPYIRMLGERIAALEVDRDITLATNDPVVLSQGANQARLREIETQLSQLRDQLRKRTDQFMRSYVAAEPGTERGGPLGYLQTLKQQLIETRFQLDALRSRRAALDGIIRDYESKFRMIPRQSVEFARLQRERLSTEKLYGLVEEKYNEAAITEKSEYGYVNIIDLETPATVKGRMNLLLNMILGLLIGLGLAVSGVVLKEALDVRVRTPEQLLRGGFPPLTEIPILDRELKSLRGNGGLPAEVRHFDRRLQLIYNPISFTAESYRRLRTSLMRMQMDRPLKVVLFTSPNPGEGKTTTLLNLALSLAEAEQRTLVIDADLRRPRVHTLLGLRRAPGLSDVVDEKAKAESSIIRDVVPYLDVLTCGKSVKHPSQQFGSKAMTSLLTKVRDDYVWVLLDSPPVLIVNDAAVLSALSDASVLMVTAAHTRFAALERAAGLLERATKNPIGVILGRFDPKAAYGAYYGGARYGHYDNRNHYYQSLPDDGANT